MVVQALIAFALPATAAVIYHTLRPLWSAATNGPDQIAGGTYQAIANRFVLFVMGLYALALATLVNLPGARAIAPRAAVVLVGALLIAIGNLLPRTRPNLLIGLRTAPLLENRELWIRMHRTCGYLAVGFGAVVIVSGAFLSRHVGQQLLGTASIAGLFGLPVMYWRYSAPPGLSASQQRARRLEAVFWIHRLSLAAIFVVAGFVKIPGALHPMWVHLFDQIGFGQWFRYVTALVEITGGMLLVMPSATLVSLTLLMPAMVGALLVHVFVIGIGFQTLAVLSLLAGLSIVGWRWRSAESSAGDSSRIFRRFRNA